MAEKTTTKKAEKLAVIRTGGKQYLVREDDVIKIEKLPEGAANKDGKIDFKEVLMVCEGDNVKIGRPLITGQKVSGEVMEEGRDKKISVIHYKSKSRYFKRKGHRQPFTKVKITKID